MQIQSEKNSSNTGTRYRIFLRGRNEFLCGPERAKHSGRTGPRLCSNRHSKSDCHSQSVRCIGSTTSLASHPPPSILSLLICSSYPRRSLSARSHSSRPATAQVPLLTLFHPPHCVVFCCLPLPVILRTCRECNTYNTQPSGGCSACSGRSTRHSHGRAAARVDRPKRSFMSVHRLYRLTVNHSHTSSCCHRQQSGKDAMRKAVKSCERSRS